VKLSTKKDKTYLRTKWLYHKADWEKVNHSITTSLTNISSYTINQDVNETWSYIQSSIHNAINEHIPKRVIKRSPHDKPWFTDDCAIACDQKTEAYKKYRASGTDTDKQFYRKSIDTAQAIYKRAQEQYKIKIEHKLIQGRDYPKIWWNITKHVAGFGGHSDTPTLVNDNILYETATEKAEL
jgi:hypothetical protein